MIPPPLPTVAGAVVKMSWFVVDVPSGDAWTPAVTVPPMKLTVAPAPRARLALVTREVAPLCGAAVKPALNVDWPLLTVYVPMVSLEAAFARLRAWNRNVPLLDVTAGLVPLVRRVRLALAMLAPLRVLSSSSV